MPLPPDPITLKAAARLLRVSSTTIGHWVHAGVLPAYSFIEPQKRKLASPPHSLSRRLSRSCDGRSNAKL